MFAAKIEDFCESTKHCSELFQFFTFSLLTFDFVDFRHDSTKHASMMVLAAPKVILFGFEKVKTGLVGVMGWMDIGGVGNY